MEADRFQELEHQSIHESACVPYHGDVCTLVRSETWPVTQHDIRRLKTFQMRCLRDIMGVTLWDMR